jgi:hypothetical protein
MGIDPVSLAVISAVATGASAVSGFVSQQQAAKQQKKANAAGMAAAEQEAKLTRADAAERARAEQLDARRVRSQQLSLYLKSGVTLDGSPMLVGKETIDRGAQNAKNIMTNADYQANSILLRGKASQQPIKKADFFGTAADVFGAGSKAASLLK